VRAIRRFTVRVTLPEPLAALLGLMLNLRWSWHVPTADLFASIDPDACQAAGSIDANRSAVGPCQDQRRFSIRPCSAASGSGRVTRTVNRRIALTGRP
jgi:hypothetical protein